MTVEDFSAFERIQVATDAVTARIHPLRPKVGVVLGSGLSPLSEQIARAVVIPYDEIPHMPTPSIAGHQGRLYTGDLSGTTVACLSGRAHLYEGHKPEQVVFGVRLLASLGVSTVIVTNAAGGIHPKCTPGTLMLISDHLNLTGQTPLLGPNEARWGTRFPDMSEAYSGRLRDVARQAALQHNIRVTEGVYAGLLGPTYETPAEIRMLEGFGASAVGMSTVLETISLRHLSVEVLGISCITNHAAGKSSETLSHDDVSEVAGKTSQAFVQLVTEIVSRLTH